MPPKLSASLSLETARTLAVIKQGLDRRPPAADKQTLFNTIRRIGLLQLDTVNVIARSHYLAMLSRVGLYDRAELDALLYPDRKLFEQWAHAACLIPIEDYAYFAPLILARRGQPHRWYGNMEVLGEEPQAILDGVLAEIKERGALASKDFHDPRDGRGSWWDWKPAKHALNVLYDRGYLMVDRRVNFQIYYDLAERVLPASAEPPVKTVADFPAWAVWRSVGYLGVATARQVSDYYRLSMAETHTGLEAVQNQGKVVAVAVAGWPDTAYVLPEDIALIEEIAQGQHQPELTTFLSPFDNLTWNRDRLADLFSFDYRIELYTPTAKRKYGYYVLPILHNGLFVGRLDPKADRKNKTFVVHAIYLEPGVKMTDELVSGMAHALHEFMLFHRCETVTLGRSEPAGLKDTLALWLKHHPIPDLTILS
jgi:hypothetical protein